MERTDFTYLYTEEEKERFAWCRSQAEKLNYRPLISIVVPVYRTPIRLLDEMISSVLNQSYANWELCIANASPEQEVLTERLKAWQAEDARIHIRNLEENKGISANTNKCFEMVQGEYTAMLDHDDVLTENALFEVVWCLQDQPELDFIYSDQDMLDEESVSRFNPLYKPEWSKDTMYSGNYITHFSVLRTSLIREIGGWNPETDGAQDWDLFLKAAERTDRIHGIPQILYHWRMARTSTASSMETKTYALDAQVRAINEHLHRVGETRAQVYFYNKDIFKLRIDWNREHRRDISVILLDEGRCPDLKLKVQLLRVALKLQEREILVVSNSRERLRELEMWAEIAASEVDSGVMQSKTFASLEGEKVKPNAIPCVCIYTPYRNWAEGYNAGTAAAHGDILLFCTDSVLPLQRQSLLELADWALYDRVAIAGPKIVGENRMIEEMGVALTKEGPVSMFKDCFADGTTDCGKNYWYRNVHAVNYSCFAVRKSLHEEIGGFRDELDDLAMLEYCMELEKRHYRHTVTPYALVETAGIKEDGMCIRIQKEAKAAYEEFWRRWQLPASDCYYRRR